MLHPYSTFWDKIDMEVINPHDRKSKTGKTPIYFETVPKGSRGVFRIIYVPLHWIMLSDEELEKRTLRDLRDVVIGLKAMMLVYGFSAKKSTGYGVIKDEWDKDASKLMIKDFVKDSLKFSNFEELTQKVSRINERLNNE
jgi:CRISPR-associated protein Cmr2